MDVAMAAAPRKQISGVVKFDHPNFNEISLHIRPPNAQNLIKICRYHGNCIMAHVGDTMGCDDPSLVQISPLIVELWHFE